MFKKLTGYYSFYFLGLDASSDITGYIVSVHTHTDTHTHTYPHIYYNGYIYICITDEYIYTTGRILCIFYGAPLFPPDPHPSRKRDANIRMYKILLVLPKEKLACLQNLGEGKEHV